MVENKRSKGRKLTEKEIAAITALLLQAGEKWPTTFVPRSRVPEFTGGLYSVGTMANADCAGVGPEGGFRIGRQWCYPTSSLVDWLISKVEREVKA